MEVPRGVAPAQEQQHEILELPDKEVGEKADEGLGKKGRRWKLSEPITLNNGAKYTGELLDGRKDGLGEQIWQDGSRYDGQWKDDQANGFGKMIHADGNVY